MKNLRKLSIYDLELSMPSESAPLLRNVTKRVSLRHLEIGHPGDGIYFSGQRGEVLVAHEILLFLRQQPLLQHLALSRNHQSLEGQRLLASDIPILRSICGVASDIAEIVPGRPVMALNIYETGSEPTTELWAKLHTSTALISKLTLHIIPRDRLERNLKGMAEHLTQLQSLTLIGVREDKDYAVTSANICLFANLQDLTIHLTYPSGFPKFDVWDDLHASCPNLGRVSVIRDRAYYPCHLPDHNSNSDSSLLTALPSMANLSILSESEIGIGDEG
ncbi:hypothetical protein FRB95_000540 [Tulasnella sp. JGI-2019a]|nr:hypothetical protein FRB95_000540 [Tulasnella sp. JGI-2019a]